MNELVHATTIAIDGIAILIRGAPGSGKTSLALQLLDSPGNGQGESLLQAALVCDDQTLLSVREGVLWAGAPAQTRGLMEVRGMGIVEIQALAGAKAGLVVDLGDHKEIERLPEASSLQTVLLGVTLPRISVDPRMPSAAARVRLAFRHLVLEKGKGRVIA